VAGDSVIEADTVELDNPHTLWWPRGMCAGCFRRPPGRPRSFAGRSACAPGNGALARARRIADLLGGQSPAQGSNRAPAPNPLKVRSMRIRSIFTFPNLAQLPPPRSYPARWASGTYLFARRIAEAPRIGRKYTASDGKFVLSGVNQPYMTQLETRRRASIDLLFADDRIVVDSEGRFANVCRFTGSRNEVECSSCRPSSLANRTRT